MAEYITKKAAIKAVENAPIELPIFSIECRVGCEKCGIYFRQNSVISRAEYIAPVTNRDRYEEAAEAWNRRADNGSN